MSVKTVINLDSDDEDITKASKGHNRDHDNNITPSTMPCKGHNLSANANPLDRYEKRSNILTDLESDANLTRDPEDTPQEYCRCNSKVISLHGRNRQHGSRELMRQHSESQDHLRALEGNCHQRSILHKQHIIAPNEERGHGEKVRFVKRKQIQRRFRIVPFNKRRRISHHPVQHQHQEWPTHLNEKQKGNNVKHQRINQRLQLQAYPQNPDDQNSFHPEAHKVDVDGQQLHDYQRQGWHHPPHPHHHHHHDRDHPRGRDDSRRPSLPELSLHLRPPMPISPRNRLPPLLALTVDNDFIAPALMTSVLRLHIVQSAMFLRQSNVKLQEEIRDAMKSYGEEKSMLRAQLANLRLDLGELHHDNRTVTTDETASHVSLSNNSQDSELKRLVDFDGESSRSLQLPSIKNLSELHHHSSPHHNNHHQGQGQKSQKSTARDSSRDRGDSKGSPKDSSSKSLRFTSSNDNSKSSNSYGESNHSRSFLVDNQGWENKQESQKFLELQRNQEVLRNIGRAHLKEKRQSLIRLPTINSAKKRTSLWDSGTNVSRPKGKSTEFELNPYLEDVTSLNRKNYLIPVVNDPHRSEVVLKGSTKRPTLNKRKVQFTRPREDVDVKSRLLIPEIVTPTTEANSLNTSMADVSLEDNTLGNITFDDDTFKSMMNKTSLDNIDEILPSDKTVEAVDVITNTTTDEILNTPPHQQKQQLQVTIGNNTNNNNTDHDMKMKKSDPSKRSAENSGTAAAGVIHPHSSMKTNYLAKKNLELHNNLNSMRVLPPLDLAPSPKLSLSPETKSSCKDSDRSVGTKLSHMSHHTEMKKNVYLRDMDPKRRNQALSDIMFAVRSRMRENEEALRFGQTPRPQDRALDEYAMFPRHVGGSSINGSNVSSTTTPRWSNASNVTASPRKAKNSRRGPVYKLDKPTVVKRKTSNTTEVQSYLRKMYRQRKTIDRMAGTNYKVNHFAGHKQLRMIAQEA